MLNSKRDIRREIEKTASSLQDEEIFSSKYFYDILYGIANGACNELGRDIYLNAFCDKSDSTTAYTNGAEITINTLGPLIKDIESNWGKYVNNVGHMIHECGHILFTDFDAAIERRRAWNSDKTYFYGKTPEIPGLDVEKILEYLDSHPVYKKMYIHSMCNLDNVMEDVFIENCLYDKFDGIASIGLQKTRDELYRQSKCVEDIYQCVLDNKITPLDAFINMLLIKRTGYEFKTNNSITKEQKDVEFVLLDAISRVDYEIDALRWESNGSRRNELLNTLFCKLQYLLPEPPDNDDYSDPEEAIKQMLKDLMDQIEKALEEQKDSEGEGSPSSIPFKSSDNSRDYSDEDADSKMDSADDSLSKDGMSEAPTGCSKPVANTLDKDNSLEKQKEMSDISEETCKSEFEKAKKEVATNKTLDEDEEKHQAELQSEADEIDKDGEKNSSIARGNKFFNGIRIDRPSYAKANSLKDEYLQIFENVKKYSDLLAKKINNILKSEREVDSPDSGYLMGNIFNAKDVYHNDGKYFSRTIEPDGKLKVVFSILVDESGSMRGRKSEVARKATIMLENTLRKLNVPFMIAGHTDNGQDVIIKPYCDFDTNDGLDRYRLADISADWGNIDGAAIKYMGDKLLKRPEEIKVLIVISDGEPAGVSYFHEYSSDEDTKLAVEYYRKKGIKVFGAVVDEWESVSQIYGQEYSFDARENGALEQTFAKLVKRFCLIR